MNLHAPTAGAAASSQRPYSFNVFYIGSTPTRVWFLTFGALCFHLGFLIGHHQQILLALSNLGRFATVVTTTTTTVDNRLRLPNITIPIIGPDEAAGGPPPKAEPKKPEQVIRRPKDKRQIPSTLVAGATNVVRDDFVAAVGMGVPIKPSRESDVLILYMSHDSLPSGLHNATKAIDNCLALNVVLVDEGPQSMCIAVVPHYESRHVHRYRRIPPDVGPDTEEARNKDLPLRLIPQEANKHYVPSLEVTNEYWKELVWYLSNLQATLTRLEPLAKEAAGDGNTIVVMVTNYGQSELLVNYVCAARSRGLNITNVLLFATDRPTFEVATSMGIKVFDVQGAFGEMPQEAAGWYADKLFARMALSKIYATHLMVVLGYDVLLQDVDVVWWRNPLDFLRAPKWDSYDLIFQDDGGGHRFAPYFGNTGFYFVRSNLRTVDLYNSLIRRGDMVAKLHCDQETMAIVLNEHVSLHGLRVKTFGKHTDDGKLFPCGFHYERQPNFMKQMIEGSVHPYIFHMSWTRNKAEKLEKMKQLGEWFVTPVCENRKPGGNVQFTNMTVDSTMAMCCSPKPLIQCFYGDLPSHFSCRNTTTTKYDNGESFW